MLLVKYFVRYWELKFYQQMSTKATKCVRKFLKHIVFPMVRK